MTKSAARDEMLFSTALALPPAERDVYLDRACTGDDSHARVQGLLNACDRSGSLLRSDVVMHVPENEIVRVDNYRVIEDLGEGGWGTVYRAEQIAPLRREVALKMSQADMDPKAVIIRFEAERQALAMMDHPNIAKVFDAGATNAGRPYFAMELVRGVKITQYCDSHQSYRRGAHRAVRAGMSGHPACTPQGHHSSRHQTIECDGDFVRWRSHRKGHRLRGSKGNPERAAREHDAHGVRGLCRHACIC